MQDIINNFKKKHNFLICVDSDGCAIDTMEIKHTLCFGPCAVRVWELEQWEYQILDRWNNVNLFSLTRGINRFKALIIVLEEADRNYKKIMGLSELKAWVEQADSLSNDSIKDRIRTNDTERMKENVCLKKALLWSEEVNQSIEVISGDRKNAYPGVREALLQAREYADIAVVSSANRAAVTVEWERNNLTECVDVFLTQDIGSKSYCIKKLLENGYQKQRILMVGDAKGDLDAAISNHVFFYPILVRKEAYSWEHFGEAMRRLIMEDYAGTWQDQQVQKFMDNLSEESI